MRIAFVGLRGVPAAYSGVERAVEEIGCRLASRGHDITVFCMSHHFERRPVTHRGMLLKYVPSIRSNSLEMITHAFLATLSTLTGRYDVMHFHALGPSTLSFLPRLFGKQTVVTVHGLDWKREKWGALARAYLRFGEAASCRFPDATIVVSEVLRDHYAAKYEADTVYIPNGVPTSEHKVLRRAGEIGELRAREYILFVGRLTPEKNVHQLIRAFRRLNTTKNLVIVGGAGHLTEYGRQLDELAALDSRVLLAGQRYGEVVSELLSNAYLYVLPSSLEGLPIALIEALSFGVPALVSDIPENLEVITHGGAKCAFVFQAGSEDRLHDALETLINRPESMLEIGRLGQTAVRAKYDWDAITDATETLYSRLAASANA
ncbi:MAG: glycosyl transferase family 1 [Acidobacteria bacterium]|nr:MAG: glycosyl transferase family 1 [Acidobacteriota bacterium]PYR41735.1 MAG: glycosyl transferase family 1 [Acidobacteriota bacterium]